MQTSRLIPSRCPACLYPRHFLLRHNYAISDHSVPNRYNQHQVARIHHAFDPDRRASKSAGRSKNPAPEDFEPDAQPRSWFLRIVRDGEEVIHPGRARRGSPRRVRDTRGNQQSSSDGIPNGQPQKLVTRATNAAGSASKRQSSIDDVTSELSIRSGEVQEKRFRGYGSLATTAGDASGTSTGAPLSERIQPSPHMADAEQRRKATETGTLDTTSSDDAANTLVGKLEAARRLRIELRVEEKKAKRLIRKRLGRAVYIVGAQGVPLVSGEEALSREAKAKRAQTHQLVLQLEAETARTSATGTSESTTCDLAQDRSQDSRPSTKQIADSSRGKALAPKVEATKQGVKELETRNLAGRSLSSGVGSPLPPEPEADCVVGISRDRPRQKGKSKREGSKIHAARDRGKIAEVAVVAARPQNAKSEEIDTSKSSTRMLGPKNARARTESAKTQKSDTSVQSATLAPPPSQPGFKTGRFWQKLRELSANASDTEHKTHDVEQNELQDLSEQEIQEDIRRAKEGQAYSEPYVDGQVTQPTTPSFPPADGQEVAEALPTKKEDDTLRRASVPKKASLRTPRSTTPHSLAPRRRENDRSPFDAPTILSQQVHPPLRLPKSGKRAASLLTELFPEATRSRTIFLPSSGSSTTSSAAKPAREIPLIPLAPSIAALTAAVTSREMQPPSRPRTTPAVDADSNGWTEAVLITCTVLVLRKASAHLLPADFHRINPSAARRSAAALPGWFGDSRDGLLKVIKARNNVSLDPIRGQYFLIFATEEAAKAYRNTAYELHNFARTFSPVEATGALRGVAKGDASRAVQLRSKNAADYVLALPGHDLDLKIVRQPLTSELARVVGAGGYERLVGGRASPWEVLLTIENQASIRLNSLAIRKALVADGRARGQAWAILQSRAAVRELDIMPDVVPPQEGDDRMKPRPLVWRKFVVAFEKEGEAERFLAQWHRRDISALLEGFGGFVEDGVEEAVVDVEVV